MSRVVRCIPSGDLALRDAATDALAAIDPRLRDEDVAWALAAALRPTYPAVIVHRQDPLARILGQDLWYAQRDGTP